MKLSTKANSMNSNGSSGLCFEMNQPLSQMMPKSLEGVLDSALTLGQQ